MKTAFCSSPRTFRFIEDDYNELITVYLFYCDNKTPHYQFPCIHTFVHIYVINKCREFGKFNYYNRFLKKAYLPEGRTGSR